MIRDEDYPEYDSDYATDDEDIYPESSKAVPKEPTLQDQATILGLRSVWEAAGFDLEETSEHRIIQLDTGL
jgi:hypothetical protein